MLWLPPSARQAENDLRHERAVAVAGQVESLQFLETWNRDLKEIDPYLEMVKARDDTHLPELRAGFYHVIRHNPGAAPLLRVVEGPNGEFKEPDSSVFEMLKREDCWSDRSMREREKIAQRLEDSRKRRKAREHEDRMTEAMDRLKAYNNPGVSMADTGNWRYRAGARTEKKAA